CSPGAKRPVAERCSVGNSPLVRRGGCAAKENAAKPPKRRRRGGGSQVLYRLCAPPPRPLPIRLLRDICLRSRPPLLMTRGICTTGKFGNSPQKPANTCLIPKR